eukprot:15340201-Ditylum_brightwellii.AAC.1
MDCSGTRNEFSEEYINDESSKCDLPSTSSTGSDAWLTPTFECNWGGVFCNNQNGTDNRFVERIQF